MSEITLRSVGTVHSTRGQVEDDEWDRERVYIELDPSLPEEAFAGLDSFSHVEVVFHMNLVDTVETGARHPRGNTAWPKVGIFAQRAKNRPNQLGLTVCRVEKLEGRRLHLRGLDAVDGSPVLDVKPWVREFGPRGDVVQPGWISELMREYW